MIDLGNTGGYRCLHYLKPACLCCQQKCCYSTLTLAFYGNWPIWKNKRGLLSVGHSEGLACCMNASILTSKAAGRSGKGERGCHLSAAAWTSTRLKCPGDDNLICSHTLMEDVGNAKVNQGSQTVAEEYWCLCLVF